MGEGARETSESVRERKRQRVCGLGFWKQTDNTRKQRNKKLATSTRLLVVIQSRGSQANTSNFGTNGITTCMWPLSEGCLTCTVGRERHGGAL